MTTYEMDTTALSLLKENTDDATRTELSPLLLIAYNDAYREICRRFLQPKKWEDVELDANKQFSLSTLSSTPAGVVAITDHQDYTSASGYTQGRRYSWVPVDEDTVVVIDADASATVYVQYEFLPPVLLNPNPTTGVGATSPALIPEQYHLAFCYRGMAEISDGNGETQMAAVYMNKFEDVLATLKPIDRQEQIQSVYTV